MKNNIFLSVILILISSCSTLAFWDDDTDDEVIEPVALKSFKNEYPLSIEWKKSFKGENDLGSFKPSFYSGNMLVADPEGNIASLNPQSGKENWKINLNRELASGVASGFGKLVVSDLNGFVIALDIDTQEIIWEKNIGGEVLSNAVVSASLILVKNSVGELVALSALSGETKWSFRSQLPALTVRGTGESIIENGIVFSTFDNGRLAAFQLETGFFLWDAPISFLEGSSELENLIDGDSAPVLAKQLIFATNYQGNLTAFDVAQKRPVWNADASSFYSPIVTNNMIMVIQDDGSILSFSLANLSSSWTSEEYLRRQLSSGVAYKNLLLVGDLDGYVHAINPMTGITVGRKKVSGNPIMNIVTFRDFAYVIDQESNVVAIQL
ncbi:outer membrane protein assembly factor BamB [Gammaproteobacteria bacterium]|nr:outer membrane protein assembly factor BamB [Gammaproteobacteria bacterium]